MENTVVSTLCQLYSSLRIKKEEGLKSKKLLECWLTPIICKTVGIDKEPLYACQFS